MAGSNIMQAPDPKRTLLHVEKIEIQSTDGSPQSGILAISKTKTTDEELLCIQATDGGRFVFHGSFTAVQIQQDLTVVADGTSFSPIEYLLSYLARKSLNKKDDDSVQIIFRKITDDKLQIKVSERRSSGFMHKLWEATILRQADYQLLSLAQALIDSRQEKIIQVQGLQRQLRETEEDRDGWKDTAEKLTDGWEKEKSKLFHNFLILYEQKQEQAKELQQQVENLQQDRENLEKQLAEGTSRPSRKPLPDYLKENPDDDDQELYDAETVRRLAAGVKHKPPPAAASSSAIPAKKKRTSAAAAPGKWRRNEMTGATEYYDSNALFDDPTLFQKKYDAVAVKKEDAVGEDGKPAAKSPVGKKKAAADKKSKAKREDSADMDWEKEDSEQVHHFPDVQNEVLAQITAMTAKEQGADGDTREI